MPAMQSCRLLNRAVEVEVRDLAELDEALRCGTRHVLPDSFSPQQVAETVEQIAVRAKSTVSGNIRLETVREYAEADYISVGALTHSAPAADISFRLEWNRPTVQTDPERGRAAGGFDHVSSGERRSASVEREPFNFNSVMTMISRGPDWEK